MFVYPWLDSQCSLVYKQPKGKLKFIDVTTGNVLFDLARHDRLFVNCFSYICLLNSDTQLAN